MKLTWKCVRDSTFIIAFEKCALQCAKLLCAVYLFDFGNVRLTSVRCTLGGGLMCVHLCLLANRICGSAFDTYLVFHLHALAP